MKLWHLDSPFKVRVLSASYVNVKEADLIYVRVGVYHGTEALCQVKKTNLVSHSAPRWETNLEFDLFTLDLPRAAKLCASICAVRRGTTSSSIQSSRTGRGSKSSNAGDQSEEHTMLCWGNISLFDWRGRLASGRVALNLWSVPRDMDDLLNPLGCVGSNPMKDSPCLELELDTPPDKREVIYPGMADFKEYARFAEGLVKRPTPSDPSRRGDSDYNVLFFPPQKNINESEKAMLRDIATRDPLAEISEQEKVSLWKLRHHCCNLVPDILPRFLDAVKWNSRDDVTQLYLLLEQWPQVSPQVIKYRVLYTLSK